MIAHNVEILGCHLLPVVANRDGRGCLFEIYRQSWPGAFATLQWNACASAAGVVRGAHVHADYDELYTLPKGRVKLGLVDIRAESPTFRKAAQLEWSDRDAIAVVIPRGVAHVVRFVEDSVLVFGLSGYWTAEADVLGCQWDDPALGLEWDDHEVVRSCRDTESVSFEEMVAAYQQAAAALEDGGRRIAAA